MPIAVSAIPSATGDDRPDVEIYAELGPPSLRRQFRVERKIMDVMPGINLMARKDQDLIDVLRIINADSSNALAVADIVIRAGKRADLRGSEPRPSLAAT